MQYVTEPRTNRTRISIHRFWLFIVCFISEHFAVNTQISSHFDCQHFIAQIATVFKTIFVTILHILAINFAGPTNKPQPMTHTSLETLPKSKIHRRMWFTSLRFNSKFISSTHTFLIPLLFSSHLYRPTLRFVDPPLNRKRKFCTNMHQWQWQREWNLSLCCCRRCSSFARVRVMTTWKCRKNVHRAHSTMV